MLVAYRIGMELDLERGGLYRLSDMQSTRSPVFRRFGEESRVFTVEALSPPSRCHL